MSSNQDENDILFPFYNFKTALDLPDRELLIENMIARKDFVVLFGSRKSKKSYVSLDLALSVASGQCFAGRYDVPRPYKVKIMIESDREGFRNRLRSAVFGKFSEHKAIIDENLHISDYVPQLFDSDSADFVDRFISDYINDEIEVDLLIIDTFNRAIGYVNEDSVKEMSIIVSHIDRIRDAFGCAVLVVHDTDRGDWLYTGGSVVAYCADVLLKVSNDDKFSLFKARDFVSGDVVRFDLVNQKNGNTTIKWLDK